MAKNTAKKPTARDSSFTVSDADRKGLYAAARYIGSGIEKCGGTLVFDDKGTVLHWAKKPGTQPTMPPRRQVAAGTGGEASWSDLRPVRDVDPMRGLLVDSRAAGPPALVEIQRGRSSILSPSSECLGSALTMPGEHTQRASTRSDG